MCFKTHQLNCALEYAVRKVKGLILRWTHQFVGCADGVNSLGESVRSAKTDFISRW